MITLSAPAVGTGALADRDERAPVVLLPVLARLLVHVVPEEPEVVAAIFRAVMCPAFGHAARKCAKLERPDVAVMPGLPGAEIRHDTRLPDARFLFELTQCGSTHAFTRFDAALHKLHAPAGVFERQNLSHRRIAEHHGANLVDRAHVSLSLILRHLSNFFAKVMPAWAGLLDGRPS